MAGKWVKLEPNARRMTDTCKLLQRAFTVQKVKKFHKIIVFGIAFVFVVQISRSLRKQQRRGIPKIPVKGWKAISRIAGCDQQEENLRSGEVALRLDPKPS